MDPQQNPQRPSRQHLQHIAPLHPAQIQQRTANSTPVSSPGLFSPTNPRSIMSFPSQPMSEGTTPLPASTSSPYLQPLQTHRVRETHTANVDRDFMTGRKIINQYEVIEEIGRGQHGKVKLARNLETGEHVAIKIIPRLSKSRRLGKVSAADPQQNTKREIAILKKIRHPNVVALLEVIDDPELRKIYMVLEHVERGEIVWRKKGLPQICNFERLRIEKEKQGERLATVDEDWVWNQERRPAYRDPTRMTAKSASGLVEQWTAGMGAAEESTESSVRHVGDPVYMFDRPHPRSHAGSRTTSRAASTTRSTKSTSRAATPHPSEPDVWPIPDADESDMETPGPLRSNPASLSALDGTMYGPYAEDPNLRGRSPSMADSIASYMSSLDFNAQAHDHFADDFSYVPCFTMDQARSTFQDTVLGLEYLHYHGVVHRDIKPANLLWTSERRVKISDFGVSYFGRPIREGEPDEGMSESEAQDFDDDRELSKTVGTPAFFAPELCYTDIDKEPPKVSEQIDVWSLGVTLYCLIFARIPFLAEEEFSMFRKIATEEVYIPRRRLRPVDAFTDPINASLYHRRTSGVYRNDEDPSYEDVDDSLIDLLESMLIKNPEKRIRLRDVKRHRWVTEGISHVLGWIDDTEPSRRSSGRRIQVNEGEIGRAVVPLTLLERARSAVKRTIEKVIHPRADRAESSSRRRAASSAASSAGDSPSYGPSTPYSKDARRKSLRGSDDYFATVTQMPSEHPLTHSVTASPQGSPHDDNPLTEMERQESFNLPLTSANMGTDMSSIRMTNSQKSLSRHVQARSVSNAFLNLSPDLKESQTVPTTPLVDNYHEGAVNSSRKTRDVRPAVDETYRARSMDRAGLVFPNADKRADAMVGLSTAIAPGNVQPPRHGRQMRSIDLGTKFEALPLSSPRLPTSQRYPTYQHGQPKSDSNIHERQRAAVELEERPATAHRIEDIPEGKTPPPRIYNSSTPESFARAQEQLFRRQRLEFAENVRTGLVNAAATELDPADIPCPPSPDDELSAPPTRGNSRLTAASSSSASVGDMGQTPLTSPSEMANASFIANAGPPKNASDPMLSFQSDPSLPALLSGASSVSADVEGDFLGSPGVVNRSSLIDTTDSLTPPALTKEPIAGFPLEQHDLREVQTLNGGGIIRVNVVEPSSTSPAASSSTPGHNVGDDDDDSDSDEGLVMAKSKKKKPTADLTASSSNAVSARRRDTNTSIASTETAKKVVVHSD